MASNRVQRWVLSGLIYSIFAPIALFPLVTAPVPLFAQVGVAPSEVFVNSETENYLRLLQARGKVAHYPWSLRALSPHEIDRLLPPDTAHPWADKFRAPDTLETGLRWTWVRPAASAVFNSAFPYGSNDGPVWAGRGLTTAVQAGAALRVGPLSVTIAPIAFRAENADFELADVEPADAGTGYEDWRNPSLIDLPQRFGSGAHVGVDPGESTARLDILGGAIGVSTASQHWGPATQFPLILGNNAPGFLHGFLGTSTPVNVGIGRIHGRVVWGVLNQSEYSPVEGVASRRFMSGLVAVFTPKGLDGLELGGARFFHTSWSEAGLDASNVLKPFEGFWRLGLKPALSVGDSLSDRDNQIASVFGRWVFAGSGFEVYGEFSRDDHSYNLRHFLLEPDYDSGYMVGFRKVWQPAPARMLALRGEVVDARLSHLSEAVVQEPIYTHFWTRQGHTQRGQIIGSPAAYGGAGAALAVDAFYPGGRWTVRWTRTVRQEAGELRSEDAVPNFSDVLHSFGAESVFFRGRLEILAGLDAVYNLNRNFQSDKLNLHSNIGVRVGL